MKKSTKLIFSIIIIILTIALCIMTYLFIYAKNAANENLQHVLDAGEKVFELKEGTLYPILHGLEEEGVITSYWDETTAKKRKYYAITEKGKKQLKDKKEEWNLFSKGIAKVIGGVSFAN